MNYTADIDGQLPGERSANADSPEIRKLQRLAWLLDSAIRIPGTSIRIGLDGLIGLVPGIGDITAGAASSYILLQAVRMGAPLAIVVRMAMNILLESVIGIIPVVGDIFDFVFKANQRNVQLLLDYKAQPSPVHKRSLFVVTLTIVVIVLLLAIAFWALVALLSALAAAL
ncbi:MAG: DUF4112 domain-containing protein [Gammaproteobacteria bacterium]|nr:DUF4112 domain-containing protein [Gammaproteobacteria bacterium]